MQLPEEIADLVESGVSILIGTRDAAMRPATARGVGAKVGTNRDEVTVFLAADSSKRALENLRANRDIAVGFSRPFDHLSVQLKGRCTDVHLASEDERSVPERYAVSFVEMTYLVGLPRSLTKRLCFWPAWAVSFDVRELFSQTPGPGAGRPWDAR